MKNLRCWAVLLVFVAFGTATQTAFATESPELIASAIELEGFLLDDTAMEEIEGGLPRACHDPNYDKYFNSCMNNKGQDYKDAKNDCDIWAEKVLKDAGNDISIQWDPATTTSVAGHMKKLGGKLLDEAPLGWSIEFIDNNHVALVRRNNDGSADLFHQGYNSATPTTEAWVGSRGYHYKNATSARWGKKHSPKFWDFD
ncbi:MAG: hypothetical protein WA234_08280 [Rectinemataceae bacterium]